MLKKVDQNSVKRPTCRRSQSSGIIYLSHIPYGFYENEMKDYFSQFGEVTNLRLCRSVKTGRSMGYAFIKFKHSEVAKVAAETMNNYIMHGSRLISKYVPPNTVRRKLFSRKSITRENYPLKRKRIVDVEKRNCVRVSDVYKKWVKRQMDSLNKKLRKLKDLNIEYNFKPVEFPEKESEEP